MGSGKHKRDAANRISIPMGDKLAIVAAIRERKHLIFNPGTNVPFAERSQAWDEVFKEYLRSAMNPIDAVTPHYIKTRFFKDARRMALYRRDRDQLNDVDRIILDIIGERVAPPSGITKSWSTLKHEDDEMIDVTGTDNWANDTVPMSDDDDQLTRSESGTDPIIHDVGQRLRSRASGTPVVTNADVFRRHSIVASTAPMTGTSNSTPIVHVIDQSQELRHAKSQLYRSVAEENLSKTFHHEVQTVTSLFANRIWPIFGPNGERSYRRMTDEEYNNGVITIPAYVKFPVP